MVHAGQHARKGLLQLLMSLSVSDDSSSCPSSTLDRPADGLLLDAVRGGIFQRADGGLNRIGQHDNGGFLVFRFGSRIDETFAFGEIVSVDWFRARRRGFHEGRSKMLFDEIDEYPRWMMPQPVRRRVSHGISGPTRRGWV